MCDFVKVYWLLVLSECIIVQNKHSQTCYILYDVWTYISGMANNKIVLYVENDMLPIPLWSSIFGVILPTVIFHLRHNIPRISTNLWTRLLVTVGGPPDHSARNAFFRYGKCCLVSISIHEIHVLWTNLCLHISHVAMLWSESLEFIWKRSGAVTWSAYQ